MKIEDWFMSKKMGEAIEMLRAGAKIGDIIIVLGFTSRTQFESVFRKINHTTPGKWRNQIEDSVI